ncbi:hypothetical protein AQ619_02650 [Caulobacter henricii]|uniref:Uncharacterized protein n=2 Tax=Caulobacter henricii TaxID=69395 RepID=A0A0P0NWE7_9CAUL|nr:hypothetical protein AQ619_02650 [Caulobacter henricii]
MIGMACIRICIEHGARETSVQGVTPGKIDRTAALYIEARWPPPRRFGQVAPGAYVLVDPNAERLDGEELKQIASELQLRLFGTQGRDDLCMLTHEGDETEVLKFAVLPEAELLAMRAGAPPPPVGLTRVVTKDGVRELADWGSNPTMTAETEADPAEGPRLGWRGVYNPVAEWFEASQPQVLRRAPERAVLDDGDFMRSDLAMLDANVAALERQPDLRLQSDFRLWSLVRVSLKEAYQAKLEALPDGVVKQLSAQVYEVPRDLPFLAIAPLRDLLRPRFSRLEFRTEDPGFDVRSVPPNLIDGVVLQLSGKDEMQRLLNLRRFLSGRRQYLELRLRQGVTGVASRREFELCRELKLSSVTGPFVSKLSEEPLQDQGCPRADLPFRPAKPVILNQGLS